MNANPKPPKAKQRVLYWPNPRAPQGPTGALVVKDSAEAMKAVISTVHNPRLVDIVVTDHAGGLHPIRFVPFLHDGDPDPGTPCGRCQETEEREGPGELTLNPGTEQEFRLDPNSGTTTGHPT